MSSTFQVFDSYSAYLNHHGLIPFIEEKNRGFGYYVLCGLRCQCILVMAAGVTYLVIGISDGIDEFLHGAAHGASFEATPFLLSGGLAVSLIAWLFYRLFGWLLRALQGPPARLVDLSYYGLRVSSQYGVQPVHGPALDAHGRVLLPWTDWLDILECRPHREGLLVEVRGLSEGIVLSLPRWQAENAAELATTLHRLARHRAKTA